MASVLMTCDLPGGPGPSSSHSTLRGSDASEGHRAGHWRQQKCLLSPCKHLGWNLARTGFWILHPTPGLHGLPGPSPWEKHRAHRGHSRGVPWICLMFQALSTVPMSVSAQSTGLSCLSACPWGSVHFAGENPKNPGLQHLPDVKPCFQMAVACARGPPLWRLQRGGAFISPQLQKFLGLALVQSSARNVPFGSF